LQHDGGAIRGRRPAKEARMHAGQRVRLKPDSRLVADRGVSPGCEGIVICAYEGRTPGLGQAQRADVRFEGRVLWSVPSDQLEPMRDARAA
jgi:hypothetical protein